MGAARGSDLNHLLAYGLAPMRSLGMDNDGRIGAQSIPEIQVEFVKYQCSLERNSFKLP